MFLKRLTKELMKQLEEGKRELLGFQFLSRDKYSKEAVYKTKKTTIPSRSRHNRIST